MCLYVKKGCKPEIAEKDILCYKVVKFANGHSWVSPYMISRQAYNRVLRATEPCNPSPITSLLVFQVGPGEIRYGFHAWTDEAEARDDMNGFIDCRGENIYATRLAIIPAGAEYCYGTHNDIVATKMIVFGSKTAYQKYLAAKK